jgi:hypothetical protein
VATANQDQAIKKAHVSKAIKKQVMSAFRRYAYLTIGWILAFFSCFLLIGAIAMIYSHFYPSCPSDRDESIVGSAIISIIFACLFAFLGCLSFVKAGIKLKFTLL